MGVQSKECPSSVFLLCVGVQGPCAAGLDCAQSSDCA